MKMFFKKYKYMCITLIPEAWWDFITDARFVLPKTLFFSCCSRSFFLTFSVRTRPPPHSPSLRAIGKIVVGNYASNCSPPCLLPNSQTWSASTTHCTHSKVSKLSDKIKKNIGFVVSLLLQIQQLFTVDCLLSSSIYSCLIYQYN